MDYVLRRGATFTRWWTPQGGRWNHQPAYDKKPFPADPWVGCCNTLDLHHFRDLAKAWRDFEAGIKRRFAGRGRLAGLGRSATSSARTKALDGRCEFTRLEDARRARIPHPRAAPSRC